MRRNEATIVISFYGVGQSQREGRENYGVPWYRRSATTSSQQPTCSKPNCSPATSALKLSKMAMVFRRSFPIVCLWILCSMQRQGRRCDDASRIRPRVGSEKKKLFGSPTQFTLDLSVAPVRARARAREIREIREIRARDIEGVSTRATVRRGVTRERRGVFERGGCVIGDTQTVQDHGCQGALVVCACRRGRTT